MAMTSSLGRAVSAVAAGLLSLPLPAQSPTYVFAGDALDDWMGSAVASAGDVDGDGHMDLIAGAPGADTGGTDAGIARVWSGVDGGVLLTITGDSQFDQLGIAVAGAGDVNGDGRDDVLVGAWLDDPAGTNSGSVRLVSGADGSTLLAFSGPAAHAHLGHAVAGAGDVDLDGVPDLAIGAPGNGTAGPSSGSAFLYSGATGAPIRAYHGSGTGDIFGRALVRLDDLDGDGLPELAASAPLASGPTVDAGVVRVHSGSSGALWFQAQGTSAGAMLGESMDGIGDVDGDGREDLVVSAHGKGETRILSGLNGAVVKTIVGTVKAQPSVAGVGDWDGDGGIDVLALSQGPYFLQFKLYSGASGAEVHAVVTPYPTTSGTAAVAGPGDVDGDGSPDLMIGLPTPFATVPYIAPPASGYVLVYAGPRPCAPAIYSFTATTLNDGFGGDVASAGDLDGDSIGDFLIGVPLKQVFGATAGGSAVVRSGADGATLFTATSSVIADSFGASVIWTGDLDGDGVTEIAVGAPYLYSTGSFPGQMHVYSGASGSLAYTVAGSVAASWFGVSLASVGDVDGDGISDIAIGAPAPSAPALPGGGLGSTVVVSGATGVPIHTFVGGQIDSRLGWSVAGAGDVDLDGTPDVLVGAPEQDAAFFEEGLVRLYSGATGAALFDGFGGGYSTKVGGSVASAGDVDADGVPDLIGGGPSAYPNSVGTVRVWSGATRALLHTLNGEVSFNQFGSAVARAGDVDADGHGDFLVSAPYIALDQTNYGVVRWYSGRTGQFLRACSGTTAMGFFGSALALAGDLDGDGSEEVVIGAPGNQNALGSVHVLSGALASLVGTPLAISAVGGATQALALDAGPDQGGKVYLLLGTTSGTQPGIAAGSLLLPLNPDGYFFYTLGNPNHPPLAGSLGLLDGANGTASASFTLPPGVGASLAGLDVHHAFAVLDAGGVGFTSNAAALFLK